MNTYKITVTKKDSHQGKDVRDIVDFPIMFETNNRYEALEIAKTFVNSLADSMYDDQIIHLIAENYNYDIQKANVTIRK